MEDLIRIEISALIVSVALMLSGCALWPQIKADKKLKPEAQEDASPNSPKKKIPCITENYNVARECAERTVIEIGDLLESSGEFDRGAAYAALGLATATGSVIAFTGGSAALKGLAIASGTLLGLNSFVNSEQQRSILKKGLKDMLCYIHVADSVYKLAEVAYAPSGNSNQISQSRALLMDTDENFKLGSLVKDSTNTYEVMHRVNQLAHYNQRTVNLLRLFNSIESPQSIGRQLSDAVIEKRAELRGSLASLTPKVDSVLNEQRNRIVDMAGQIVAARAAIKKQSEELIPQVTDEDKGENGQAKFANTMQELKIASHVMVTETSAVSSAFSKCVDQATNEALNH